MKYSWERWISVGVLIVLISAGVQSAVRAGEISQAQFPPKEGFDIYYSSGESQVIVRDVEVVGIKSIHNVDFLVFISSDFKLKNLEGYVRFDSVQAIVPNRTYRLDGDLNYR